MELSPQLQSYMQWNDIVSVTLCMFLHKVCNDQQFKACPGSSFVQFLNLRETAHPIVILPRQRKRVCYLIFAISETISPRELGKEWTAAMLHNCGISAEYYGSHRSDVRSIYATDANKTFCKTIDKAINEAIKFTRDHS